MPSLRQIIVAAIAAAVSLGATRARGATDGSFGAPNAGWLDHGEKLVVRPFLRILPNVAGRHADWGVGVLVGLLEDAARDVHRLFPRAVTRVGDLSRRSGGVICHHHSHESGRDADVAFFYVDARGGDANVTGYLRVASVPRVSAGGLAFDDARNWQFVQSLITNPRARVMAIFVARWLRQRLLRYGARVASPGIVRRAAEVMLQPSDAPPHDDHFHVRIACPPGMLDCIDAPVARRTLVQHSIREAHRNSVMK